MSKRKVTMVSANDKRVVVYRCAETGEYSLTFWRGAEKQTDAEYFTDSKQDALATATRFVIFE